MKPTFQFLNGFWSTMRGTSSPELMQQLIECYTQFLKGRVGKFEGGTRDEKEFILGVRQALYEMLDNSGVYIAMAKHRRPKPKGISFS